MKKIGFLSLFFLTFLVFAVASVSKSEGAPLVAPTSVSKGQLIGMIKPTLETYVTNHPNMQVRVWSMIVLTNMDKLNSEQISTIVPLVRQLGSKDANIRQIAVVALRQVLVLNDIQWKMIVATFLRTIAKTTNYPEVKRLAIKSIGVVQSYTATTDATTTTNTTATTTAATDTSETSAFDSLLLLFDLAEDEDPDIRQVAIETIQETLESLKPTVAAGS